MTKKLPMWKTVSDDWSLVHGGSLSGSNWPGLDALTMTLSEAILAVSNWVLVLLIPTVTASRLTTNWKYFCEGLGFPFLRILFDVVSAK